MQVWALESASGRAECGGTIIIVGLGDLLYVARDW